MSGPLSYQGVSCTTAGTNVAMFDVAYRPHTLTYGLTPRSKTCTSLPLWESRPDGDPRRYTAQAKIGRSLVQRHAERYPHVYLHML